MRIFTSAGFLVMCLLLNASLVTAQTQTSSGSKSQAASQQSAKENENNEKAIKKEESQRMVGVIPQFGVTSRHNAPPLTRQQKFHLFVKSAFDPAEFALTGAQAGISQAEDEFPEYGQGAAGYGKRYGAAFADEVSSSFFSDYLYPVIFKEDPRYFRLGEGPIKRRIGYSLKQIFVCRTDSGQRTFNWSSFLGALTSGSVSNIYYPQSDRGFGLTMSRTGIAVMYGSLGGLADEFWPDIDQKLIHRHSRKSLEQ